MLKFLVCTLSSVFHLFLLQRPGFPLPLIALLLKRWSVSPACAWNPSSTCYYNTLHLTRCLTAAGRFPAAAACCGCLLLRLAAAVLQPCKAFRRVCVLRKLLLPPSRNMKHSIVFTPRRKAAPLSASSPLLSFLEPIFRSQTGREAHRQVGTMRRGKVIISGLSALLSARFQSDAIAGRRSLK